MNKDEADYLKLISYSSGLKLYGKMPRGVKDAFELAMRPIPRSMLLGKGFQEHLTSLMVSDKWSLQELQDFQLKRLRALIVHAYRNVPYYHELLKKEGKDPSDISGYSALMKLPQLTKDIVRSRLEDLKAVDRSTYLPGEAYTTGSTGRPLNFLLDQQTREFVQASVWRHYLNSGISGLGGRIASFRGDFVSERNTGKLWRWDGPLKELTFNTYALTQENVDIMIRKLNQFKPEAIRGYPHSLYIFSKGVGRSSVTLTCRPRFVHTSSEQLPGFMRKDIEQVFRTKIVDWYGQSECIVAAGECTEGHYHQEMETGIMNIAEDAWGMEKLIGTSLWNFSMPFINYEIGDHILVEGKDCPCGRKHVMLGSIEGRLNDVIITDDGRALSGVGIDNFYEKEVVHRLAAVPEFLKLVQEDIGIFTIEVFRRDGLREDDLDTIHDQFSQFLGSDTRLTIRPLDTFPDQKKWKNVESKLSTETIARILEKRIE